jgi:hypothetical protein
MYGEEEKAKKLGLVGDACVNADNASSDRLPTTSSAGSMPSSQPWCPRTL